MYLPNLVHATKGHKILIVSNVLKDKPSEFWKGSIFCNWWADERPSVPKTATHIGTVQIRHCLTSAIRNEMLLLYYLFTKIYLI